MNRRDVLEGLSLSTHARELSPSIYVQNANALPMPVATNDRLNVGVSGPRAGTGKITRELLQRKDVDAIVKLSECHEIL